jgi:NAD(P)-dependent dehydrogenase (short-subunit alcohol dehydrogenase family)
MTIVPSRYPTEMATPLDLTRVAVVTGDAVPGRSGHIDVLVNAAGIGLRQPAAGMPKSNWTAVMDINFTGTLRACQLFHRALKACGRGPVVNIASLSSFRAFHLAAAYSASRTAVLSLTRSLAREWACDEICVSAVAPGVFPADLIRSQIIRTRRGEEILVRTPMGRLGNPEELAGVAVLLASDGASFWRSSASP